jgi:hypothetical protein
VNFFRSSLDANKNRCVESKMAVVLPLVSRRLKMAVQHTATLKTEGVKVKLKFSLEQAMKAQRGSRGIALLFL